MKIHNNSLSRLNSNLDLVEGNIYDVEDIAIEPSKLKHTQRNTCTHKCTISDLKDNIK
jgi:hypothetical protein